MSNSATAKVVTVYDKPSHICCEGPNMSQPGAQRFIQTLRKMGKGRKPNPQPDCMFPKSCHSSQSHASCERFPVIEISGDGLKARCTTCLAGKQNGDGWINKGSIGNHLKSENHARSLEAREVQKSKAKAAEQTMREESAMEEHIDFITLSSTIQPEVTTTARAPRQSEEEEQMWNCFTLGEEIFDAGIDQTLAATLERKRLEQEANDLNLWHGADLLPEEDISNGGLLLDELEQSDTLSELLRNARRCIFLHGPVSTMLIMFWIDLNAPDAVDVLSDELQGTREPKNNGAWSPYESKMVGIGPPLALRPLIIS